MKSRELLIDTFAFAPPKRVLDGLTPEQAERHVAGLAHSVAEIIAHMAFWQNWFCRRLDGVHETDGRLRRVGMARACARRMGGSEGALPRGLERVAGHGDSGARLDQPLSPAIEFPPLAHYTTRDALVHVAHHNAYHLGQIVSLRQAMGLWPPAGGGWTW